MEVREFTIMMKVQVNKFGSAYCNSEKRGGGKHFDDAGCRRPAPVQRNV